MTRTCPIAGDLMLLLVHPALKHRDGRRYAYVSTGGHTHIRFRSPYGLSIRPTDGQNLLARTHGSGNAAFSRGYGCVQASAVTDAAVCGAFFSTLSRGSALPVTTSSISCRMAMSASQNRSSSAFASLSVGSTMRVPGTGNDTVGAWKP